jgi:hypothetical protein
MRAQHLLALAITTMLTTTEDPEDQNVPLAGAASVLAHVGEGFALVSQKWPIGDISHPSIPSRVTMSQLIDQFGVEPWCRAHGHQLTFFRPPPGRFGEGFGGPTAGGPKVTEMALKAIRSYHQVRSVYDRGVQWDWDSELRDAAADISRQREAAGAVLARALDANQSVDEVVARGTIRILGDMRFQVAAQASGSGDGVSRLVPPTLATFVTSIRHTGMDESLEAIGINLESLVRE